MIQHGINNMLGREDDALFAKSLDDTLIAYGAPLAGIDEGSDEETVEADCGVRRAKLLESETVVAQHDMQMIRKDEFCNKVEAHILELCSTKYEKMDLCYLTHQSSLSIWI